MCSKFRLRISHTYLHSKFSMQCWYYQCTTLDVINKQKKKNIKKYIIPLPYVKSTEKPPLFFKFISMHDKHVKG